MVNNFKSIKLPSLSTSFSESGKSAKRRFDNILSTRAKKTGVFAFALILLIVGIVGIIFGFNSDKDISYACKTFDCSFDLPKSWENKYEIVEHDNIVYVYHKDIREKYGEGTGILFYIETLEGDSLTHDDITDPGNRSIALQEGGYTYVFGMPTDVQHPIWDGGDKALADDYVKMSKDHDIIKKSMRRVAHANERLTAVLIKDAELNELLNIICSSPLTSSNPNDYIKQHQTEFDKIVAMDNSALSYIFAEFEKGSQTDLRGHIMMNACRSILGSEDIKYTASTGQHWYDAYKDFINDECCLKGSSYIKENYTKALILLKKEYIQEEMLPVPSYNQIMKKLESDFYKAYSSYYEIVEFYAFDYSATKTGEIFEATFFYKMIYKNHYKDPDTVDYIKKARESGNKNYKQLYDEYNLEKEANYNFRVTANILRDASLDMSTFKLYASTSPKDTEWQEIENLSVFIEGNDNE